MGCFHRTLLPPTRALPPASGQSRHPLLLSNNVGLSAVCAYNLSTAEAVFSRGKYMQSATVEQSHTKWVRYNGAVPTPRPGAVSGRRLPPGSGEGRGHASASWVLLISMPFHSRCCKLPEREGALAATGCVVGLTLHNRIRSVSFSVSCRET